MCPKQYHRSEVRLSYLQPNLQVGHPGKDTTTRASWCWTSAAVLSSQGQMCLELQVWTSRNMAPCPLLFSVGGLGRTSLRFVVLHAFAYVYTQIYVCVYIDTHRHICMGVCIYIYIHAYICTHIHAYIHAYIHIYTCMCMYVYVYIRIYIYIHIRMHTLIYVYVYRHRVEHTSSGYLRTSVWGTMLKAQPL